MEFDEAKRESVDAQMKSMADIDDSAIILIIPFDLARATSVLISVNGIFKFEELAIGACFNERERKIEVLEKKDVPEVDNSNMLFLEDIQHAMKTQRTSGSAKNLQEHFTANFLRKTRQMSA